MRYGGSGRVVTWRVDPPDRPAPRVPKPATSHSLPFMRKHRHRKVWAHRTKLFEMRLELDDCYDAVTS